MPSKRPPKESPARAAGPDRATRLDRFALCDLNGFGQEARDVLNARWRELSSKYPVMEDPAEFLTLAFNAEDVVGFADHHGVAIHTEHGLSLIDARDILLLKRVLAVEGKESDAASDLHRFLSNSLHRNNLTAAASHLLAAMHCALAFGVPADMAMLSKPQSGRPTNAERDEMIRRFVTSEGAFRGTSSAIDTHPRAEDFKRAASFFGLSVKTVRNICSKT